MARALQNVLCLPKTSPNVHVLEWWEWCADNPVSRFHHSLQGFLFLGGEAAVPRRNGACENGPHSTSVEDGNDYGGNLDTV